MIKYTFVTILVTSYLKCAFPTSELDFLKRENFQIGISSIGARLSDNQCGRDIQIFLKSVEEKELWALKLIDSFGVIPKSFHWGNYFWYSSRAFCEDLNEPIKISLSDRYHHTNSFNVTSPFAVRFWMVYLNFTSPVYVDFNFEYKNHIHVGLCLPQSCSKNEVIHYSQSYFEEKSFRLQELFDIQMDVVGVKSPDFKWSFFLKTGVLISFVYLALSGAFMIIAHRIYKKYSHSKSFDSMSRMEQFFLCFHVKDNYRRSLGDGNSKGFMPAIAGLRTLTCMLVTLGHIGYFSFFATTNLPEMVSKFEQLAFQPIFMAVFYEDIFFVISSFILVYTFLSNVNQMKAIETNTLNENLVLFLRKFLSRYMRLLPVMLATFVAVDILYDLLDMYSPLRMDEFSPVYCKENLWYNILFINNFLDLRQMCCSWTWYLACEMQLFILFTGLLIIFAKNNSIGTSLFKVLLVAGVAISFFFNYNYEITFQFDVISGTYKDICTKPWIRINSYTGGALIGWLFWKTKEQRINVNTFWKSTFWTFAFCLILGTSYMSYWRTPPNWVMATTMSFGKLIFALCIGGMIVMCEWGYGGLFNSFLSSRLFLFLNNLCFIIYMISPVIIVANYGLEPEAMQLNVVSVIRDAVVIIIFSTAVSFVLMLLVGLPAEKFIRTFITGRKTVIKDSTQKSFNLNCSKTDGHNANEHMSGLGKKD